MKLIQYGGLSKMAVLFSHDVTFTFCDVIINNQIIQYLGRLSSVALVPWCCKLIFVFFFGLQVFIGLGFPYEGPAPLEAIAQGCIFLNAKVTREIAQFFSRVNTSVLVTNYHGMFLAFQFDPPHNRINTEFFKLKPTLREVSSSLQGIRTLEINFSNSLFIHAVNSQ